MSVISAEASRVLDLLDRCPDGQQRSGLVVDFVPLDEDLQPCGSSQTGVTRELSKECIGLLSETPAGTKYLRLSLPGAQETTVLFEVLRCQQFGCFFEITARVLAGDPRLCTGRKERPRNRRQGACRPGMRHTREGLSESSVEAI